MTYNTIYIVITIITLSPCLNMVNETTLVSLLCILLNTISISRFENKYQFIYKGLETHQRVLF